MPSLLRDASKTDKTAVWAVAERIAAEVDAVLATEAPREAAAETSKAQCACSSPVPGGTVAIRGTKVTIPGLSLIFEQCAGRGIPAEGGDGRALLDAVRIYHAIDPEDEAEYRTALIEAYRELRSATSGGK